MSENKNILKTPNEPKKEEINKQNEININKINNETSSKQSSIPKMDVDSRCI